VLEALPRSCRSKTSFIGELTEPAAEGLDGAIDAGVVGLEDTLHLRAVQADAQRVGVAGEERVGCADFSAVDEGRDDGGTIALADVVSSEAVCALRSAGVEAAEDSVGGRGELNVARLDDQRAAHLDLVDGGEGVWPS